VTTHTLGEKIRVPIKIKDPDGISRVYAGFRLLKKGSLGPGSLDPRHGFTLQGEGAGREEATVELGGEVTDVPPGDYLCVALHVYDEHDNVDTIENPHPSKILRIVRSGGEDPGTPAEFLGWEG
jgi:hypothetical protein